MTLSRRRFLAGSGAAFAASALAGAARPRPASARPGGDDWDSVRALFDLDPDRVHMSALLIAAHPRPVREAIEQHRRGLDRDPVLYLSRNNARLRRATRSAAAGYLGGHADEIALTDSTTMGLGLVYGGLRLREGQELLSTEHDYFVTHESLRLAAERSGATTRQFSLYRQPARASADEMAERAARALSPQTRVLALTWVHSSNGVKIPLAAIADRVAEANRERDADDRVLLCVDAVHGFGVEDVDVSELGVDFFVAGCHKWLFGPRGTGIVWAPRRAWTRTLPIIPSFLVGEVRAAWRAGDQPEVETSAAAMTPGGFKPFEHQWALAKAFELHREIGKARVESRTHELARQLKEGLAGIDGVALQTPVDAEVSSGIVCFDVEGLGPRKVVAGLREAGVVATVTPYAESHARLAPSIRNSPEEVDRAVRAVRGLRS